MTTDDANSTEYFEIQSKTEYSPDDQVYVTETNNQGTKIYYQIDKQGKITILNGTVAITRYGENQIQISEGMADLEAINLLSDEKL